MYENQGRQKPYESSVCHGYQGIYASAAEGRGGKLAASVIGNIWNNIGVAHTGLFLTGMRHDALRKLMTIITIRHVCGRWKKHGGWQHRMKRNRFMRYQKNCKKTLEDIHKQWNDEEEVLEAFRDVLDKKKKYNL